MTVTSEGLPRNLDVRRGFQAFHTQRPLVLLFAMRINNLTVIYFAVLPL